MPPNFVPNSYAYTAVFPDGMTHLVYAQFAVQSNTVEVGQELFQSIYNSFALPHGPKHVDRALSTDKVGLTNQIWLAYWDSTAEYEAWQANTEVQSWFHGVTSDTSEAGFWREVHTIPTSHFETIHSGKNHDNGVSHFLDLKETKEHEYWGGMHDRIQISQEVDFDAMLGTPFPEKVARDTYGKNIRVIPQGMIAFIRTAQDWTKCNDDERTTYLEDVQPTLIEAERFMGTESAEAGCLHSRFLHEMTNDGQTENKTCVTAYFLTLQHLEEWSKSHPTHLEIFRVFFKMLGKYNYKLDLALWHEVSVLSAENLDLFYSNCHPQTGFLPYYEAQEEILVGTQIA